MIIFVIYLINIHSVRGRHTKCPLKNRSFTEVCLYCHKLMLKKEDKPEKMCVKALSS